MANDEIGGQVAPDRVSAGLARDRRTDPISRLSDEAERISELNLQRAVDLKVAQSPRPARAKIKAEIWEALTLKAKTEARKLAIKGIVDNAEKGSKLDDAIEHSLAIDRGIRQRILNEDKAKDKLFRIPFESPPSALSRLRSETEDEHSGKLLLADHMLNAELSSGNDNILLDTGTTTFLLERRAWERHKMFPRLVLLNHLILFNRYLSGVLSDLEIVGGDPDDSIMGVRGKVTNTRIAECRVNKVVASIAGISEGGLWVHKQEQDDYKIELLRKGADSSVSVYLLIDSEKVGKEIGASFLALNDHILGEITIITDDRFYNTDRFRRVWPQIQSSFRRSLVVARDENVDAYGTMIRDEAHGKS